MSKRDPLQVSPEFRMRIIQLQNKLQLKENKRISIRELTERIANGQFLDDLEKKMLETLQTNGDIKLNFDRRKKK